ncbi:MAG TPA: 30S ribosomal protein S6 [Ktedonobacteraceae bacterium]|nr:30S ribosomal protein S6 [Ktedonobacteraceae bacterium]
MVTRDYELGFILNPEVSEEQTQAILNRVEQIVATHGGQIVRVNKWGRRRLSYPIEHHRDGNYIFLDMILTPETVAELDRTLKVSEEVLRHLMKRRDARTVQKEREARAAAEAAAGANAQEQAEPATANIEGITAAVEEALAEQDEESMGENLVEPISLTEEDMADVPPAIDEETLE